ncbi:MAG: HAD-IIIA family hydrolase [Spirochaetaceae bacterium]|jgi:D-glycero-D-manno-heptose 1,7-bisphosphate phosphatase|nr:HAD-IIIA family hydrolase [Spirochaetaceae bacterium]
MKAVIMAGGRGTRIASIARDIPKPMIPLAGKPVIAHQIERLMENGFTDITVVVGHLGQQIKDYFGCGYSFDGNGRCAISYYTETEPLGTAGALYKLPDVTEDFLVINGDIVFDIDFSRMLAFHKRRNAIATLAAHPNSHPEDSALLITDGEDRVTAWLSKEDPRGHFRNLVNAGIHLLKKEALPAQRDEKVDLDRNILKPLIASGGVFAYKTPEYIKDMGTPERYAAVSRDMEQGIVGSRNLSKPQKAVFLDRDGTINRAAGFVRRPEELVLLDGAAEAVRLINRAGYLAIVITNQPVIARGEVTLAELAEIHRKMETDLGREGAFVDDIFFCPHHPDRGYAGERAEYKIDCACRKPAPGLILQAAAQYTIDPGRSFMVGDSPRDVLAGIAAGCTPVLLSASEPSGPLADALQGRRVDCFPSLRDFALRRLPPAGGGGT